MVVVVGVLVVTSGTDFAVVEGVVSDEGLVLLVGVFLMSASVL